MDLTSNYVLYITLFDLMSLFLAYCYKHDPLTNNLLLTVLRSHNDDIIQQQEAICPEAGQPGNQGRRER